MNRTAALVLLPLAWLTPHVTVAQNAAPAAAAPPAQQRDFSKVQIKVHQVAGNVYYLEGEGGNVGLLVGDDGVIMIDDQFAPLSDKLLAGIKTLSTKPIRLLINTHVHGDHTGGNENFGKMGISIVAHDSVRERLAKGVNGARPSPAVALPVITYGDKMHLHFNGEDIEIGKLPPAHTDGDTYIRFPKADVIHVGDVFRTTGYPGVDGGNGGTVKGTIAALEAVIAMAGPNTKIIPGHGVVSSRDDVIKFRDATVEAQKRVAALIKQGMTLEQVTAANPVADLAAKFVTSAPPPDKATTDRFYNQFYTALKGEL
ncbi:MAG TPA: MBL fold metallo-hydrolase [Gammaproteobacteria bacterium]|nr:MBL fold metallo-hydrolase [Gammaproteobacteria bacterium]